MVTSLSSSPRNRQKFTKGRRPVKPPFFAQVLFGITGALGTDPENLMHMKVTADRFFLNGYLFSALSAGRVQTELVTMSAIPGGNVHVGLEDDLYIAKGLLAKSNAEQVHKIRRILDDLGHELACAARHQGCRSGGVPG